MSQISHDPLAELARLIGQASAQQFSGKFGKTTLECVYGHERAREIEKLMAAYAKKRTHALLGRLLALSEETIPGWLGAYVPNPARDAFFRRDLPRFRSVAF